MLKRLRNEASLTQAELAAASGISVDAIRALEQGRFGMKLDTANKLARALANALGRDISLVLIQLADEVPA